jgi:hypothetical protein
MFDETSPAGPPSRALRPIDYSQQRTESGTPKKMTKAQFEMLQRHGNKSVEQSEDESGSGDEYDDDGEEERVKQATQQRRKQEANMSVYRQQMKKLLVVDLRIFHQQGLAWRDPHRAPLASTSAV